MYVFSAVQQKPSPQDSTGRRSRGQGDADGDDFLKMLGITPDDKTQKYVGKMKGGKGISEHALL